MRPPIRALLLLCLLALSGVFSVMEPGLKAGLSQTASAEDMAERPCGKLGAEIEFVQIDRIIERGGRSRASKSVALDAARVVTLQAGCAGQRAGLKPGDAIYLVDGQEISADPKSPNYITSVLERAGENKQAFTIRVAIEKDGGNFLSGPQQELVIASSDASSSSASAPPLDTAGRGGAAQVSAVPNVQVMGVEFIDQTVWSDLTGTWTGSGKTRINHRDEDDWKFELELTSERELIRGEGTVETRKLVYPGLPLRATKKQRLEVEDYMRPRSGTISISGEMYDGKNISLTLTRMIEGQVTAIKYAGEYNPQGTGFYLKAPNQPDFFFRRVGAPPARKYHEWASWRGVTREEANAERRAYSEAAIQTEREQAKQRAAMQLADCREQMSSLRTQEEHRSFLRNCTGLPDDGIVMMNGKILEKGLGGEPPHFVRARQYYSAIKSDSNLYQEARAAVQRTEQSISQLYASDIRSARAAMASNQFQQAYDILLEALSLEQFDFVKPDARAWVELARLAEMETVSVHKGRSKYGTYRIIEGGEERLANIVQAYEGAAMRGSKEGVSYMIQWTLNAIEDNEAENKFNKHHCHYLPTFDYFQQEAQRACFDREFARHRGRKATLEKELEDWRARLNSAR